MFSHNNRRRIVPLIASIVLLFLAVTACGSPSGNGQSSSTLRFGYVGADTDLPPDEIGWGLKQGVIQTALAKHGVDEVETTGFLTGPDLNESVLSGRIDVTLSGDTPALTARGAGGPTRLLAIPSFYDSVIITKDPNLNDVADLEGKKVSVVKGSAMHRFAVGVLDNNQVDAEIININATGDSIAAAGRGEVDAVATGIYVPAVQAALKNGFRVITTAADYPDLKSLRINTVTDNFLEGHPDLADAWAEARAAALTDIRANENEYYDWLAEITNTARSDVAALYSFDSMSEESLRPDLVALLEGTKNFLVDQKLIRNDFDLSQWPAS